MLVWVYIYLSHKQERRPDLAWLESELDLSTLPFRKAKEKGGQRLSLEQDETAGRGKKAKRERGKREVEEVIIYDFVLLHGCEGVGREKHVTPHH